MTLRKPWDIEEYIHERTLEDMGRTNRPPKKTVYLNNLYSFLVKLYNPGYV